MITLVCYVHVQTFNPLALLMALRGLSTRSTRRIFTTLMALDLKHTGLIYRRIQPFKNQTQRHIYIPFRLEKTHTKGHGEYDDKCMNMIVIQHVNVVD